MPSVDILRLARERRVQAYLEDLIALCSPGSPTGSQIDFLSNGLGHVPSSTKNVLEDRLLRLIDKYPNAPRLSMEDLHCLLVYYTSTGSRYVTVGQGGEITEQWASGVDHRQAAAALGIRGPNASRTARRRFQRILRALTNRL